ncbi:MAG: hypothetical protein ABIE84_06755 [bacterium]
MIASCANLRTGDVVDRRFRLTDKRHFGGMSIVRQAVDLKTNRQVALKIMSRDILRRQITGLYTQERAEICFDSLFLEALVLRKRLHRAFPKFVAQGSN